MRPVADDVLLEPLPQAETSIPTTATAHVASSLHMAAMVSPPRHGLASAEHETRPEVWVSFSAVGNAMRRPSRVVTRTLIGALFSVPMIACAVSGCGRTTTVSVTATTVVTETNTSTVTANTAVFGGSISPQGAVETELSGVVQQCNQEGGRFVLQGGTDESAASAFFFITVSGFHDAGVYAIGADNNVSVNGLNNGGGVRPATSGTITIDAGGAGGRVDAKFSNGDHLLMGFRCPTR